MTTQLLDQLLETETLPRCPICGATAATQVLAHPDGYLTQLRLQSCADCQGVYLNPRLTFAAIVQIEDASEGYNFSGTVAEEWIARLVGLVGWLEGYVRSAERRLLDIGCNRGLLLEGARRRGWQVTGVEISAAAERARQEYGLTVYGRLEELPPAARFDLITAWHVLEHTTDPVGFLRQAAGKLAPGGVLALQVPSFDFIDEYLRRNQSTSILCTVHNFYFTGQNLPGVLTRAGLTPLYLDNDANTLFLTAIANRPATPSERLTKAAALIKRGQWATLAREAAQFVRWRVGA